jgi:hypothetical protein
MDLQQIYNYLKSALPEPIRQTTSTQSPTLTLSKQDNTWGYTGTGGYYAWQSISYTETVPNPNYHPYDIRIDSVAIAVYLMLVICIVSVFKVLRGIIYG